MAEQTGSLACPICYEAYTVTADPHDRRPIIVCKNGHTLCANCETSLDECPMCREPKAPVPNRVVIDIIAERLLQNVTLNDAGVPEISADHVKQAARPFADGGYADVFDAEWQNQSVALKVLRRHFVTAIVIQDLLREARLAMSLNHPNVVRVFGVVSIDGGKGILMEKADCGSLRSALDDAGKLSLGQLISLSIDIVDGLDYTHSKQMVHRDLKPENILLFDVKSQLTAKIADFGASKVVQSLTRTAMIGTPYYMAPELLKPQVRYGSKVDVYSVAIVLYEMFSGRSIQDAYRGIVHPIQLLMCVASGQRPEIPQSFPAELRTVVERGWSPDADVRPKLANYREALYTLKASTRNANAAASASANADRYAAFEEQLQKLERSTKAYKLKDARSEVEACWSLWVNLRDRTTATASTAQFYSLKGYVHHWFGECSDANKETYQALAELYELCVSGTSVEGELVVTILRYAAEVCWSQDRYAAAVALVSYAARYAKSNLSAAAYADVLETFLYFQFSGENWTKMAEFVLSTRLEAPANRPQMNLAAAYCYLARLIYYDHSAALEHLESAQHVINAIDAGNIWAAVCKSLQGKFNNQKTSNELTLEEARQCLEDALGIAVRILGECNQTVSDIYFTSASHSEKMKRFDDAERMYKRAIKAAENSLGPNCSRVALALEKLADLYTTRLNKYQEAEALYLRSIEIHKSIRGPGHWKLSSLYDSLAYTYTKWGQTDEAATYSRLKSEVDSGKLEDKFTSIKEALNKQAEEALKTLKSDTYARSEAPGELVDVLHKFFSVSTY